MSKEIDKAMKGWLYDFWRSHENRINCNN
jgi:hypothetical protein